LEKLKKIRPKEILPEEFLLPKEVSACRLAKETFLPKSRICLLMKGNRRITSDTAIHFGKFAGQVPSFD
jgi:plasmid maintenance system antidote protein VapI